MIPSSCITRQKHVKQEEGMYHVPLSNAEDTRIVAGGLSATCRFRSLVYLYQNAGQHNFSAHVLVTEFPTLGHPQTLYYTSSFVPAAVFSKYLGRDPP